MININFNLTNPFSPRWENVFEKTYSVTENKSIEINLSKDNSIIGFGIRWSARQSHACLLYTSDAADE